MKVFLDTNVFVYGLTIPGCNCKQILKLAETKKFETITSELVAKEVVKVFQRIAGDQEAYYSLMYVKKLAKIIPKRKVLNEMQEFREKIKEKDLENIAVVKHFKIKYLVAYDRDYKNFDEYFTPKQFLSKLKEKTSETEY